MMTKKTAINSSRSVKVNFLNILRGRCFPKLPLVPPESNGGSGLLDAHRCRLGITTPAEGLIAPVEWRVRGGGFEGTGWLGGQGQVQR